MKRIYVLLLLMGAASTALAQDDQRGFYLSATAGVATYPGRPKVILGNFTLTSNDTREEDMSWGFATGYRFSRHFAFEAGYVDLGEGTAKLLDAAGSDLRSDLRFGARGETITAVVLFPFGPKWEMYLKGGVLIQDVNLRLNGTQSGVPFALSSQSKREGKLYAAGGVSYRFDSHWKVSLGVSQFPDIGDKDRTGRADIRVTALGISYQF
jgi:OOP family OmpA-OmpF porin